jgi:hypothetical protein
LRLLPFLLAITARHFAQGFFLLRRLRPIGNLAVVIPRPLVWIGVAGTCAGFGAAAA